MLKQQLVAVLKVLFSLDVQIEVELGQHVQLQGVELSSSDAAHARPVRVVVVKIVQELGGEKHRSEGETMNVQATGEERGLQRQKAVYVYQSHDKAAGRALTVANDAFTVVNDFDHWSSLRVKVRDDNVDTEAIVAGNYVLEDGRDDGDKSTLTFADSFHVSLRAHNQWSCLPLTNFHSRERVGARHGGQR